jgi:hypothetical protein
VDDLRPVTRQALVTTGLVPLGIGVLGFVNRSGWRSFFAGWVVASLFIVVAYTRSIAFESRHLDSPRAFWRDREALIRPRFFHGAACVAAIGGIALVIALLVGAGQVAAFLIAPVFLAGAFVALLWGKVP